MEAEAVLSVFPLKISSNLKSIERRSVDEKLAETEIESQFHSELGLNVVFMRSRAALMASRFNFPLCAFAGFSYKLSIEFPRWFFSLTLRCWFVF